MYIAIDGVAPRSKIQQQRKRRFLSSYRNDIINTFKESQNMTIFNKNWDSNCITPGSGFMSRLHSYLEEKIANVVTTYKIILSGADETGEGEQKIFDYMQKNKLNGVDVIYGLDADLIMLSLCCPPVIKDIYANIYLMREGKEFFTGMTDFKFLDISTLKTSISDILKNDSMYDYVFICFLLGNDFIPNISCLKIKSGAVDILIDIYKKIFEIKQKNMIIYEKGVYSINFEFLTEFLEKLSLKEDALIKETTIHMYNNTINIFKNTTGSTNVKLDRFTQELDNYPMINKFPLVIDPVRDNAWQLSYYHHLFGSNTNDIIKNVCDNYIEGLLWIVNYYFNHDFNSNWYFKYNYAPCVSDIHKHMSMMLNATIITLQKKLMHCSTDKQIIPIIQLLMVLPPSSISVLENDDNIKKIMTEIEYGCCHYYPIKFCLTSYLKHHLWECAPVLPNIDLDTLLNAYVKVTTN